MARSTFILLGIFLVITIAVPNTVALSKFPCVHVSPLRQSELEELSFILRDALQNRNESFAIMTLVHGVFFQRECFAYIYGRSTKQSLQMDIMSFFTPGALRNLLLGLTLNVLMFAYPIEINHLLHKRSHANSNSAYDVLCLLPSNYKDYSIDDAYRARYHKKLSFELLARVSPKDLISLLPFFSRHDMMNNYKNKISDKYSKGDPELEREVCRGTKEQFFATHLESALVNKNYLRINRLMMIIISLPHERIEKIMKEFEKQGESLERKIRRMTTGDYRQALLSIINNACCVVYLGDDRIPTNFH